MNNPLTNLWHEFQQASPAGKALAISSFAIVAGIGLYVGLSKEKQGAAGLSATTLPIDTQLDTSGGGGGGSGVPFANMPASPTDTASILGAINIPRPLTKLPLVKVSDSDTLQKIAHYAYGTSSSQAVAKLLAANPGLQNGPLTAGSYLMVPHAKGNVTVKAVQGDTLGTLAHYAYGSSTAINKIIKANKLSSGVDSSYKLSAGQTYIIPR